MNGLIVDAGRQLGRRSAAAAGMTVWSELWRWGGAPEAAGSLLFHSRDNLRVKGQDMTRNPRVPAR
ncbi:hypothetical protein EYF80_041340 [Liparis tanakae]|uniref:Uncharacterized protein n=1 Tax=Liparis tanakae TaxID=230148 RepID=A0A4Z2G4G5_9TELE|nr:hypothetical protein EYF80_041340 [Liparis tanakae]